MITATPSKVRVSELRFQVGTADFAEKEKGRQLAQAERDTMMGHIAFWMLFLLALLAYAAFGAAYVGGR